MVFNKVFKEDVCSFLSKQKDNCADLIIADPPYNIGIDK
jgi:DNA modification methylase